LSFSKVSIHRTGVLLDFASTVFIKVAFFRLGSYIKWINPTVSPAAIIPSEKLLDRQLIG
jgi:hypothetical protein